MKLSDMQIKGRRLSPCNRTTMACCSPDCPLIQYISKIRNIDIEELTDGSGLAGKEISKLEKRIKHEIKNINGESACAVLYLYLVKKEKEEKIKEILK